MKFCSLYSKKKKFNKVFSFNKTSDSISCGSYELLAVVFFPTVSVMSCQWKWVKCWWPLLQSRREALLKGCTCDRMRKTEPRNNWGKWVFKKKERKEKQRSGRSWRAYCAVAEGEKQGTEVQLKGQMKPGTNRPRADMTLTTGSRTVSGGNQ